MERIVFIDLEINPETKEILDFGAISADGNKLHTHSKAEFINFISKYDYLCGHNIIKHDLTYLPQLNKYTIDTLFLSPLLFPNKPYHSLVKDDKLYTEELSNPLNDAKKAMELFHDEINAFENLSSYLKNIFCSLLYNTKEFCDFLSL